ncbi:IST1 family protein [Abortiporus biennis]
MTWDVTRAKAQLRLTAQRLGQIQYKLDSQAQITRRDIATLLQQGTIGLARAKAQKLVREDIYGDLLQMLEQHVGMVLSHIGELERSNANPSPVVVEAVSSIIYAAPHTDSKELITVRDMLAQHLGPDFAQSAATNRDNYVSPRIVACLNARPPPAAGLDQYLLGIARAHNVQWLPDLQPHEKVNAISEMLGPDSIPEVDLTRLRTLCAHGLPEYPPWLRPRVWRILLGSLSARKEKWPEESQKQRDSYYDLVRRLLEPISSLPSPTHPLAPTDATIVDASLELSNVPPGLLLKLEEEPEASETCPLDPSAPESIRIECARALDERLRLVKAFESGDDPSKHDTVPEIRLEATPEIRLEEATDSAEKSTADSESTNDAPSQLDVSGLATPEISLSAPDSPTSTGSSVPTTLLASKAYAAAGANPRHASALLRLLYIHSCLNPANRSPQIASLLVPLYSALAEEVEPQDLAHIEADAFWLFETIVGEFSDLEDAERVNDWMQKLGQRLSWADTELAENLQSKGLDPSLPHYSYRWLTPLLTHTLPLPAIFTVWDALFSRPMRERDSNPKLEYLVDVCTAMLLCARGTLVQLGKRSGGSANLWGDENAVIPSSALAERELEDAFVEGMALLRNYPLDRVGGIENVLQMAFDLATKRRLESQPTTAPTNGGIGAMIRNRVWGTGNTHETITETEEESEEETDGESEYERKQQLQQNNRLTLTGRLADTVWKGITNQSAMEDVPSPVSSRSVSPAPPEPTPVSPPPAEQLSPGPSATSKLWGYAEKLRDSDTAAKFSKVSTNWKVKAWDVWSKRGSQTAPSTPATPYTNLPPASLSTRSDIGRPTSLNFHTSSPVDEGRRSSLPAIDRSNVYSPPPRPAFFRPPRDSFIPDIPNGSILSPTTAAESPMSDSSDGNKRRQSSLASLVGFDRRTPSPSSATARSGPRPLLLNSASLMTGGHSRSPTQPALALAEHHEEPRSGRPSPVHRHSQSSASSLSPDGLSRSLRSPESAGSRVVPLNRKSPSPMARRRNGSTSSTPSSPPSAHAQMSAEEMPSFRSKISSGWTQAESMDSSTTAPSPPLPKTPTSSKIHHHNGVRVKDTEAQRGSVVLEEPSDASTVEDTPMPRKTTASLSQLIVDDSDSSSVTQGPPPSRMARVRSKRYPPRLANLRTRENSKSATSPEQRSHSPNSLAAPEWEEGENATTPRATHFDSTVSTSPVSPRRRVRKLSGEKSAEDRPRKLSGDGRARKLSNDGHHLKRKTSADSRESKHSKRESAAVEGDDEGYDELLSAYESEDSLAT